jgi:hypothetical protein
MDRPRLEVADVFRCYGTDYRLQNGASMSMAQHRVMTVVSEAHFLEVGLLHRQGRVGENVRKLVAVSLASQQPT